MKKFKKALVLSPHTDDGELGCGGTMARLHRKGVKVWSIAFSPCKASVPAKYPKDILVKEFKKASGVLGVSRAVVLGFPVRKFTEYRQSILDKLIAYRDEFNPDIVFLPSPNDIHQDHYVVAMEGIRAFKKVTVLAYEVLQNNIDFSPQAFLEIKGPDLLKKWGAIQKYVSQGFRPYANKSYIVSLARVRGMAVDKKYAEAFEVIRYVI